MDDFLSGPGGPSPESADDTTPDFLAGPVSRTPAVSQTPAGRHGSANVAASPGGSGSASSAAPSASPVPRGGRAAAGGIGVQQESSWASAAQHDANWTPQSGGERGGWGGEEQWDRGQTGASRGGAQSGDGGRWTTGWSEDVDGAEQGVDQSWPGQSQDWSVGAYDPQDEGDNSAQQYWRAPGSASSYGEAAPYSEAGGEYERSRRAGNDDEFLAGPAGSAGPVAEERSVLAGDETRGVIDLVTPSDTIASSAVEFGIFGGTEAEEPDQPGREHPKKPAEGAHTAEDNQPVFSDFKSRTGKTGDGVDERTARVTENDPLKDPLDGVGEEDPLEAVEGDILGRGPRTEAGAGAEANAEADGTNVDAGGGAPSTDQQREQNPLEAVEGDILGRGGPRLEADGTNDAGPSTDQQAEDPLAAAEGDILGRGGHHTRRAKEHVESIAAADQPGESAVEAASVEPVLDEVERVEERSPDVAPAQPPVVQLQPAASADSSVRPEEPASADAADDFLAADDGDKPVAESDSVAVDAAAAAEVGAADEVLLAEDESSAIPGGEEESSASRVVTFDPDAKPEPMWSG